MDGDIRLFMPFPQCIIQKMSVTAQLDFELACAQVTHTMGDIVMMAISQKNK